MNETPFNVMKCECGGLLVPMTEVAEIGVWESTRMYLCQKCGEVLKKTKTLPV